MSTLVGGWRVGAEGVAEGAIESLKGLVELLNRRGLLSEHTSPTYSAITLTCLADIVELSENAEARELALHAEERVWEDVLAHFHVPTGTMAGPFSRAYTADLLAHPHNIHVVLRMILGEVAFVSPLDDSAEPLVRREESHRERTTRPRSRVRIERVLKRRTCSPRGEVNASPLVVAFAGQGRDVIAPC